jgi:predicted Zn-dependent peptidase
MNYTRSILPNGLRVIVVPIDDVESVTSLVMVGAGSRYETRKNNGISHFLEHMAFKGTKKRPTAREIATLIDGIGAESNAFTGKEVTGYYIKSAATHVNTTLDVLSDILAHSELSQDEINRERGVIIEEINLYEDTPMRKIYDVFEDLMYGDTPMGWDIAGTKNVINSINRADFVSYMNSLYSADNMTVVVAGKVDEAKVKADITKFFSPLKKFKTFKPEPVMESQDKPEVRIKHKKSEQAHFAVGVRTSGLQDETDRYPLSILSSILGGGMSSRLFYEVRERKGLAYYVRSYSEKYADVGYLASFAGVDPKRVDDAIQTVVEEYQKIQKKGEITEDEVKKAKEFVKGHFILELEDTKSIATHYASEELLEREIKNPDEIMKKLDEVTLDEVHDVAVKYFKNQHLNLALIGDFEDQDRFLKLIK